MNNLDKKKLAYAIIEFLQESTKDGTIKSENAEEIEVSRQCIAEAFNFDIEKDKKELSIHPTKLEQIFQVYINTQKKKETKQAVSSTKIEISKENKLKAEEFKTKGNSLMSNKSYDEAIKSYDEAIKLNSNNPVYYANRSAANTQCNNYENAVSDALQAIEIDPLYNKAYGRLGHAYFCSSKYQEAIKAYEKAIEFEPDNNILKSALESCKAKLKFEKSDIQRDNNNPGQTSSGFDFASMLNNPAIMQMANQFLGEEGVANLMNNPQVAQIAQQFMNNTNNRNNNEQNPLSSLINNPEVTEMAKKFTQSKKQDPK